MPSFSMAPLSRVYLVMWPVVQCHAEHVKPGQDVTEGLGTVGYMCMRLRSSQHFLLQDFFIHIHQSSNRTGNHPNITSKVIYHRASATLTPINHLIFLCLFVSGSAGHKYQRKGRIPSLKGGVTPLSTLDRARNASAGRPRGERRPGQMLTPPRLSYVTVEEQQLKRNGSLPEERVITQT